MTALYAHQKKIIDEDPKKKGLFLGTGSGKTATALMLAKGRTLVVCPKTQRDDRNWEREHERLGLSYPLKVVSKEDMRRDYQMLAGCQTLILDEAHTVAGVTPSTRYKNRIEIPKSSQTYDATMAYIRRVKPERIYPCTATPTRSPMAVYSLGRMLGASWEYFKFRNRFYVKLPMPGRTVYAPKKDDDTKDLLAKLVNRIGYTGRLADWMDVPEQTHKTIRTELSKAQQDAIDDLPLNYPDPIVLVGKTHQVENGILMEDGEEVRSFGTDGKVQAIMELAEEFPKVLVFAKYRAQIALIAKAAKDAKIPVYTLTGETKDRGAVLRDAESPANKRCIFIAQSQISAGYELPSFRCTIFASASYSFVDLEQAIGRTLRANALNRNLYVYLSSGEVDKAVWRSLADKKDFSERIYAGHDS